MSNKIFILEDDEPNKELYKVIFDDYQFEFSETVEEALERYEEEEFEGVLIDRRLEGSRNGEAFLEEIDTDNIYSAVVSGLSNTDHPDGEVSDGLFDDYFVKPFGDNFEDVVEDGMERYI